MGTLMTPEAPAPATPPAEVPPVTPVIEGAAPVVPPVVTPPVEEPPPAPPAAPVVPETYTLKLAENSTTDATLLERASSLAKELSLTNDAAQRVVDAVESELTANLEAVRAADLPNGVAWKARVAQYEADALADPTIAAGDPAKLELIAQRARLVAEKVGGKEILEFLGATGLGSSAPFLKMFGVKMFADYGEGSFVLPSAVGKPGSNDPAEVLYGKRSGAASTKE